MKEPAGGANKSGGEAASPAEVRAAVEALDPITLARFGAYARRRLHGCSPGVLKGRQAEDLLQEAIERTLDGRRTWKKSVSFHTHLFMVMKSIASAWDEEGDQAVPFSSLEQVDEEGEVRGPHLHASTTDPDPERAAASREQVALISEHFKDDVVPSLVITAILDGHLISELPGLLGISKNEGEAAWKKIRRHAAAILGRGTRS